MKTLRAIQKEHQDHIEALKNGEDFTPILTGAKGAEKPANTPKKRKNKGKGKKGSPKRRRSSVDSDDEDEDSEDGSDVSSDEDSDSDEDSSSDDSDGSDDEASDSERSDKSDNENGDSDIEVEGLVEEVTEESIQAKLEQTQADIRAARGRLSEARKEKKDALDHLAGLKVLSLSLRQNQNECSLSLQKSLTKVQKTKNCWCSLKRSEVCFTSRLTFFVLKSWLSSLVMF